MGTHSTRFYGELTKIYFQLLYHQKHTLSVLHNAVIQSGLKEIDATSVDPDQTSVSSR